MRKFLYSLIAILLAVNIFEGILALLKGRDIKILNPSGVMAIQEKDLIVFVLSLGLTIIISIVLLTFFIAYHYREGNKKAKYTPNWNKSKKVEVFRWGFLIVVIGFLGILTWKSAHAIDPYQPVASTQKPLTIQVDALQWRWLFIYPDQKIATINYAVIPKGTPVNFQLTADAPMSSFWVPQIGGQMYAMSGMVTQTHFMVNKTGEFEGRNAEISGTDFAKMTFVIKSVNSSDFKKWVSASQKSPAPLTLASYNTLAKPSSDSATTTFALQDTNLYNEIVNKFMSPSIRNKHMDYQDLIPKMKQ